MQPETELSPQCPDGVQDLVPPYLRRQIWKRCGGQTVLWAESWWSRQTAQETLHQPHSTIWHNLKRAPVELRRDIDQLGQVQDPRLQKRFGRTGPFWTRSYRLFKGGQVLTVIREVFFPCFGELSGRETPWRTRGTLSFLHDSLFNRSRACAFSGQPVVAASCGGKLRFSSVLPGA